MINFFSYIFGYLLNLIYQIVSNYGVAIIIFTILLKLLMIPITINQQKTMKKNAKMQEKRKELEDKYGNDLERLNRELLDLYKKEKMSPFSRMFNINCSTNINIINFLFSKKSAYIYETS